MGYKVAVVGATGNVGHEIFKIMDLQKNMMKLKVFHYWKIHLERGEEKVKVKSE